MDTGLIKIRKKSKKDCRKLDSKTLTLDQTIDKRYFQTKIRVTKYSKFIDASIPGNTFMEVKINGIDPEGREFRINRFLYQMKKSWIRWLDTKPEELWIKGIFTKERWSFEKSFYWDNIYFINTLKIIPDNKPVCQQK